MTTAASMKLTINSLMGAQRGILSIYQKNKQKTHIHTPQKKKKLREGERNEPPNPPKTEESSRASWKNLLRKLSLLRPRSLWWGAELSWLVNSDCFPLCSQWLSSAPEEKGEETLCRAESVCWLRSLAAERADLWWMHVSEAQCRENKRQKQPGKDQRLLVLVENKQCSLSSQSDCKCKALPTVIWLPCFPKGQRK